MTLSLHFRSSDNVNVFVFEIELRKYFHFTVYKLHICCVSLPNPHLFVPNFLEQKSIQKHKTRKKLPIKKSSADFVLLNSVTNQSIQLTDTIFVLFEAIVLGLQSELLCLCCLC